jgi:hypothetical protein
MLGRTPQQRSVSALRRHLYVHCLHRDGAPAPRSRAAKNRPLERFDRWQRRQDTKETYSRDDIIAQHSLLRFRVDAADGQLELGFGPAEVFVPILWYYPIEEGLHLSNAIADRKLLQALLR